MDDKRLLNIREGLQIPAAELSFQFGPSSGPGGQHVNRAHTRATLLFNVAQSRSLDEATREVLLRNLSPRLDKHGLLRITAQDSRSQSRNRRMATERFVALLQEALAEDAPRVATKPSRSAQRRRLQNKKRRGQRKRDRSRDWSADY